MRSFYLLAAALLCSISTVRAAETHNGLIVYPRKEGAAYLLHVMNGDGTGDHVIPGQTAVGNLLPVWSPDGKQIAFLSAPSIPLQDHQVAIIGADGSGSKLFSSASPRSGLASWSPDGKQLTYTSGEPPAVFVSDAQGNGARQVNAQGSYAFASFWMPDGKRLGYTLLDPVAMKGSIVLVNVDGSGQNELFPSEKFAVAGPAALSPDGKRLVFLVMGTAENQDSVHVWDFSAKSDSLVVEVELGRGEVDNLPLPSWSPDGKSLLMPVHTDKGVGLFTISEDGKTRKRLTPEGVDCGAGAWWAPR